MIPISYKEKTPEYDKFFAGFKKQIKDWYDAVTINGKSSIGMMNKAQVIVDSRCVRFLFDLIDNNFEKLKYLVKCPAIDLEVLIDTLQTNYPELQIIHGDISDVNVKQSIDTMKATNIYRMLYFIFVVHGFNQIFNKKNILHYYFNKDELIDAVNINVCPYCNRTFIRRVDGHSHTIKGELDHFYVKELDPYLAICKHNLVPCCSYCNGYAGKHTLDALAPTHKLVNPYTLSTHSGITVKIQIMNAKFISLEDCAKVIDIKVVADNPALASNIDIFNIERLYKTHVDFAAELYQKYILRKNRRYKKYMNEFLRSKGLSHSDMERLLYGFYTKESEFGKRPLSKFRYDIAKYYHLL